MQLEYSRFLRLLKQYRRHLTVQQFRTLRGQALAGDLMGAQKGLARLLKRGEEK